MSAARRPAHHSECLAKVFSAGTKLFLASVRAMSSLTKETDVLTSAAETAALPRRAQAPVAKPQPVALEVPVTVNGARTVEGSEKREPFSEATKTVLVFGTGAVIRLSSTVEAGQLLFLTNEKTKK